MTERDALLCLNAVSGLGSIKIKRLLDAFADPRDIFKIREQDLIRVAGIGSQLARAIRDFYPKKFLDEECRLMSVHRVQAVTFFDGQYPRLLKEISDPPIVLYQKGNLLSEDFFGIGIVGSRRASVYGRSVAGQFARDLSACGVPVVSGMARGIDTCAHQGSLMAGGRTVAVLGNGLSDIYPADNRRLSDEIADRGCVLSEFSMASPAVPGHFPRRNRIISGLSLGVIVVEASDRSGALITSRCALDQGREVFAVPGKIGQLQASGTNRLIQDGAKLVCHISDVLEEFRHLIRQDDITSLDKQSSAQGGTLSQAETAVYQALSDEPLYIDEILTRSGLSFAQVMRILIALECRNLIQKVPGQYYVKTQLGIMSYG